MRVKCSFLKSSVFILLETYVWKDFLELYIKLLIWYKNISMCTYKYKQVFVFVNIYSNLYKTLRIPSYENINKMFNKTLKMKERVH